MFNKLCKLFLLAFSLFSSCSYSSPSTYVKLSDKISVPFFRSIENRYNYKIILVGGSFYDNVKVVGVTFWTSDVKSIDEIRKTYIGLVEELLALYNKNEEIRVYLNQYPFQPENTDIMINSDSKFLSLNDVESISMLDGIVYFQFPNLPSGERQKYYKETYAEAYKKVYGHDRPIEPITYRAPSFHNQCK